MPASELDIGGLKVGPRGRPRKAALEALERLLRAHQAFCEYRTPEGAYGLLRPAREDEIDLIEAVFHHCGVPLPDTLRSIYRRTLGVGNPVSSLPVLAVPFLRAALPDEGYGCPVVGLETFEKDLEIYRDEEALECPPLLHLGHAAPLGLTVSRNGLWSLQEYRASRSLPHAQDFGLIFEAAFCTFVDQVLLLWANDLAGDVAKQRALDLTRGARLNAMPAPLQEAMATLLAPRTLSPKTWGEVQPLDNADLLRATRRGDGSASAGPPGTYVPVVGLPYGDRPEVAGRIALGTLLRLHPVDDNPHDPNAVEVWHDGENSVRVGFVARAEAPYVRALPDGALAWRLRVRGRSDQVLYTTQERARPDEDAPTGTDGSSQDGTPSRANHDLFSQGT